MDLTNFYKKLKNGNYSTPDCNYKFLSRIVLFDKNLNADTPITGRLSSIEYAFYLKLTAKYLGVDYANN
jgi:hypothetical protein